MGYREENVTVSGSGKTSEEAFAKAMSSIQKTLNKQVKETIIRIEPLEVEFLEGEEEIRTERFLLLFLKREVSTFKITLKVKVNIFAVNVNSFAIEQKRENRFLKKLLH